MRGIHESCAAAADEYGSPGNYVLGANASAFIRVADAMLAFGVI
jgi:glutamate dehydrogenase (NADP+)